MPGHFAPRHIPALFSATTTTLGGMLAMFHARATMLSFGLPAHIANVPVTWPVWVIGQAHASIIGILIFIFYFRRQLDIVDIILGVSSGYAALVDSYVVWSQGEAAKAALRLIVTGLFCAWGLAGLTSRR
ncbi:hypothetical protein DL771_012161 [Monosporascus sp. 5C6A]|nr:hypothetical protein DL771_012161 [Monosporascus sp. 5C6A]